MRMIVTLAASLLVAGSALISSAQAFTLHPDVFDMPLLDPTPPGPVIDPDLIVPIDPPGPGPAPDPSPGWGGLNFGVTIAPPMATAPQPRMDLWQAHVDWCDERWKTYDDDTNMYMSNKGPRVCTSPFSRYLQ